MSREIAQNARMTVGEKLLHMNWMLVFLLSVAAAVGIGMLYSAANGDWHPWASRQAVRFAMGLGLMIFVALVDIRSWLRYAYAFYFIALVMLVAVEFMGFIGMGAQRWIDLGFITLQPSEVMKIALVLALGRYFHSISLEDIGRLSILLPPLFMVALPAVLVLRQPDLGTTLMLAATAVVVFYMAGVRTWIFVVTGLAALGSLPVAWQLMHDYQQSRVLTFLDPGRDPLGAGYHITQSKIALGAGGLTGKGFMQGTQSHLSFLPEKQTDFIFTMLAEEFGMLGGLTLLGLYVLILAFGFAIALRSRNQFGRLVAIGITSTFFLYVFINIAMVMGLIPVVGVPLPLISYGGTAMLTLMLGFGLVMSVYIHRDAVIGPRGSASEF
ncbi:rod shape-determining protein RodA [Magnetospira sp. QH-2]|uniref:rod shape-determining protein RodA n=1 Tax=Magnetospira sp. (strain QH-2) TaxID=1288970 RepID=UPI0003E80E76|nr:rod shape-determining protein RodA [Magnetospira sp. QH-2]CCQ72940.1 Rod shape-determining protein rodA [Magnetospira sp. QH-2]